MADNSKINPNAIDGPNQYAGNKAPKRADASTIAGASGSYYGSNGERGNRVNPARINRTKDRVSTSKSAIFPGGESTGSGY